MANFLSVVNGLRFRGHVDQGSTPQFDNEAQRFDNGIKRPVALTTQFPHSTIWIRVPENEEILVTPGAMLAYQNLDVQTRIANNCCRRFCCTPEDSLLVNTFTAKRGGGKLMLEEDQIGQIASHILRPCQGIVIREGAFLASSGNVDLKPQVGGFSNLFKGLGSITYMKVDVLDDQPGSVYFITKHGVIKKIDICEEEPPTYIVNNNLIGYTDGLQRTVTKSGGIFTSIFGSEGLVCEFNGNGTVYVRSNDPKLHLRQSYSK